MNDDPANARVEAAARTSYGRLVALLAARSGDIAAAEDALAEAFRRALETWERSFPETGAPSNPEAWLLAVARNVSRDAAKSAYARLATPLEAAPEIEAMADDPSAIPDERLKLMFACAHPAIDKTVRAPLMLQTVLGLDAALVGAAYATPAATMAQRLVRAKQKIKAARVAFAVPDRDEMPGRLETVLEAIYGCYAAHWIDGAYEDAVDAQKDLGREALFLADLAATLLPSEPEALGLGALIALGEARRPARRGPNGSYCPLDAQDAHLWDASLIERAETRLHAARRFGRIGRFQIEAAIQSVHCDRRASGRTDWAALVTLYEALLRIAPSVGGAVGLAAALGRAIGPQPGLNCLDAYAAQIGPDFQPFHATRARLLAEAGRIDEARDAYERAIALSRNPVIADFLRAQADALRGAPSP